MNIRAATWLTLIVILTLLAPAGGGLAAVPGGATTTRVSVDALGNEGNSWSAKPDISADGRYVVFESWSDNLVGNDTNDKADIFVYDRQTGTPDRVSVATGGGQANDNSGGWGKSSISADGRYVAFVSAATNLVAGDTNDFNDIFVHDRQTHTTVRASVSTAGAQGNGHSDYPAISGDGRYVAFWSEADTLAAGDTNQALDVFVHDRQTHQTRRIAIGNAGDVGHGGFVDISNDGRYVAFTSHVDTLVPNDDNAMPDIFLFDTQTSQFSRVSMGTGGVEANGPSWNPSISSDARYVAFTSAATNLASGDTNGEADVFVRDRQTSQTARVSVSSGGAQTGEYEWSDQPAISADGRYVAFVSTGSNLVAGDTNGALDIFVRDRQTSQTTRVSVASNGAQASAESDCPAITSDGRYVAFYSYAGDLVPDDNNAVGDIFVHDRGGPGGTTYTVSGSVRTAGGQPISGVTVSAGVSGSAVTDASGNYTIAGLPAGAYTLHPTKADCAFAPTTRSVTLPPNATGQDFTGTCTVTPPPTCAVGTAMVSVDAQGHEGNAISDKPAISADGRYVVFESWADNLVSGDTNNQADVFVYDRQSGGMSRASLRSDGSQSSENAGGWGKPAISADGRYVAFAADATDLVDGDTNAARDIFVHDRVTGQTVRVSVASDGTQANANSDWPAISGDGRYVAFWSEADNLAPGDANEGLDVFVYDLETYHTRRIAIGGAGDVSHGGFLDLSYGGRYVAFTSHVDTLVPNDDNAMPDVFVHDGQTGQFSRASVSTAGVEGDQTSWGPALSPDGRYVAFASGATNLVAGDTNELSDIFLRDRQAGQTTRVSLGSAGSQANGFSGWMEILADSCFVSSDGRFVAFVSVATNLAPGDTNDSSDIFVRDAALGQTSRVSMQPNGAEFIGGSARASMSSDGQYVAFAADGQVWVRDVCPAGLQETYLPLLLKRR